MMETTCDIEIQWGDCDPAGIVFFPNYFAWFDRATWRLFARAGVPIGRLLRDKRCAALPLTKAEAVFSAPCRPGDLLRLTSRVHSIEARRIHILHEARTGDISVLSGRETRTWVVAAPDRPSGLRSAAVPLDIVRCLSEAPPVAT